MKIRHILLTTDLSEEAQRAFRPTCALARETGARLTLLNVVLDLRIAPHGAPLAPPLSDPEVQIACSEAQEELDEVAASLRAGVGKGLEITTVVEARADISRAIASFAQEHDADLICLSTHGRTGFKRLILGSVAEGVLHHAHVPVLCFPRAENSEES